MSNLKRYDWKSYFKNQSMSKVGQRVWCRKIPYKSPIVILAKVSKHKENNILEVNINDRYRVVHLDEIRESLYTVEDNHIEDEEEWWYDESGLPIQTLERPNLGTVELPRKSEQVI